MYLIFFQHHSDAKRKKKLAMRHDMSTPKFYYLRRDNKSLSKGQNPIRVKKSENIDLEYVPPRLEESSFSLSSYVTDVSGSKVFYDKHGQPLKKSWRVSGTVCFDEYNNEFVVNENGMVD